MTECNIICIVKLSAVSLNRDQLQFEIKITSHLIWITESHSHMLLPLCSACLRQTHYELDYFDRAKIAVDVTSSKNINHLAGSGLLLLDSNSTWRLQEEATCRIIFESLLLHIQFQELNFWRYSFSRPYT